MRTEAKRYVILRITYALPVQAVEVASIALKCEPEAQRQLLILGDRPSPRKLGSDARIAEKHLAERSPIRYRIDRKLIQTCLVNRNNGNMLFKWARLSFAFGEYQTQVERIALRVTTAKVKLQINRC